VCRVAGGLVRREMRSRRGVQAAEVDEEGGQVFWRGGVTWAGGSAHRGTILTTTLYPHAISHTPRVLRRTTSPVSFF